jgi:hypothetical protein
VQSQGGIALTPVLTTLQELPAANEDALWLLLELYSRVATVANPYTLNTAGAAGGQPERAVAAAGAVQPDRVGGCHQRDGRALAVECAGACARVAPAAAQDPGEGRSLTGASKNVRLTESILQGCVFPSMAPLILGSQQLQPNKYLERQVFPVEPARIVGCGRTRIMTWALTTMLTALPRPSVRGRLPAV